MSTKAPPATDLDTCRAGPSGSPAAGGSTLCDGAAATARLDTDGGGDHCPPEPGTASTQGATLPSWGGLFAGCDIDSH